MRKRSTLQHLTDARSAIETGNLFAAIELLESAIRRERAGEQRARLQLELAGCHLLVGDEHLEIAATLLEQAEASCPGAMLGPFGVALRAELSALMGHPAESVLAILATGSLQDDSRSLFHAASAQLMISDPPAALASLGRAMELGLPKGFTWRGWSLTGVAHEQLGDFELAAAAIRMAIKLAPAGEHQELERLALADCLLELGHAEAAAGELAVIDTARLSQEEDHIFRHWLQGRAEQLLGNPGLAITHYRQARIRSRDGQLIAAGSPFDLHSLILAEAQVLADTGDLTAAIQAYRSALAEADTDQLSLTRHEYAVVLIEAGHVTEAAAELRGVAMDGDYEWRADVLAELADLAFREGDNAMAEQLARQSLDVRPVPAAYLCLGSIAFEYFRLQEAVSWFEQAAAAATDGDPGWVAAQQMLADVFAQMGPSSADRLYLHAQAALKFTDQRNDWYLPLRNHAETARRALASQRRLLN